MHRIPSILLVLFVAAILAVGGLVATLGCTCHDEETASHEAACACDCVCCAQSGTIAASVMAVDLVEPRLSTRFPRPPDHFESGRLLEAMIFTPPRA